MRPLTGVALILLMASPAVAHDPQMSEVGHYVSSDTGMLVWCERGGHDYLPPEDYGGGTLAWLFAGEPECLVGDTLFGTEEDNGVGGAIFCVAGTWPDGRDCGDHREDLMQVTAHDAAGEPLLRIVIDTCDTTTEPGCTDFRRDTGVQAEACGIVSIDIPKDIARSFMTTVSEPGYVAAVFVRTTWVDLTSGTVCLGSTGSVTGVY